MRAEGTTPDDFGIGLRVGQVSWENGQVAHIVLVGDEHKAESIDFLTNMCSEQLKACQGSRFVIVDTANPIKP